MRRSISLLALGAILLGLHGCRWGNVNPRADEAISPEAFTQAYVELRRVGLRSAQAEITLEARDSVLSALGLTDQDLLTFVDVWGEDREVMQAVWELADSLLREDRMRGRGMEPGGDPDPIDPAEEGVRALVGRGG